MSVTASESKLGSAFANNPDEDKTDHDVNHTDPIIIMFK